MEMICSAIVGDLVNRCISSILEKYRKKPIIEENMQRLHQVLLRIHTVVEEAEGRHVTNQGMLQQLKNMRKAMFKGYYILDIFKYRALQEKNKDEEVSHPFALARFNQAKRVRLSSSNPPSMFFGSESVKELDQMLLSLESMIADTKEFTMFLMNCPPIYRQPYSTHLFLDKCMFGRHMEKERVINFLLESRGTENLDVLPITGPAYIGKSTLVEHVCNDEKVRNHFSLILMYNGIELKDETAGTLRDNCVVKHQNGASHERLLIIIELVGDVDDETWNRLYSSERHMAHGSKIIITSQSEKITRFGTAQALKLKCLPQEAYWYFFKGLVFGSIDPEEHPKLVSIAMELSIFLGGSCISAHVLSRLLSANFNGQYWCKVLSSVRSCKQKNFHLSGEYPDDCCAKGNALSVFSMTKKIKWFSVYVLCQRTVQDEVPRITMQDILSGIAEPRGRVEILLWKSQIPPYYKYLATYDMC